MGALHTLTHTPKKNKGRKKPPPFFIRSHPRSAANAPPGPLFFAAGSPWSAAQPPRSGFCPFVASPNRRFELSLPSCVRLNHKYSSVVGRRCRRHHHAFVRSFATDTKQTESTLSRPRFKFQTRFHSIPFHSARTHARTHRRSPRLTEHSLRVHALSADEYLKRHEWLIYPSHSTSRLVPSGGQSTPRRALWCRRSRSRPCNGWREPFICMCIQSKT